jgi:hypothetical protein
MSGFGLRQPTRFHNSHQQQTNTLSKWRLLEVTLTALVALMDDDEKAEAL